jgi:hypothetical protein
LRETWSPLGFGVALFAGTLLLLVAVGVVVIYFFGLPDSPAAFGDMFGVASALFSGLAFGGLIYAISLQRQELALQRAELEATREEMRLSRLESQRSASANELSVRLSVISQLAAYHEGEFKRLAPIAYQEFADSNAPTGRRRVTLDEGAAGIHMNHLRTYNALISELQSTYEAVVRAKEPAG